MTNEFLNLPIDTQAALIKAAENSLNYIDYVIEKDIWVCQLLEIVFAMPYNMVFKGGTSLSKGFGLINRFSEDVDITIDYRNFTDAIDFNRMSRSKLKKISATLKAALKNFTNKTVLTHINDTLNNILPNANFKTTISDNGEQIKIFYPSTLNTSLSYLRDHVLLEFGIRNEIEPQERCLIKPYIASTLDEKFTLPMPIVGTLSPVRTFWEKLTLIHVECQRDKLKDSPARLSRHWYDVYTLKNSWVGKNATQRIDILKTVINHKKAFFNSSYANYDACLQGGFRIIPDDTSLKGLERDYLNMCTAGMFVDNPPKFSEMMQTLKDYENQLNKINLMKSIPS